MSKYVRKNRKKKFSSKKLIYFKITILNYLKIDNTPYQDIIDFFGKDKPYVYQYLKIFNNRKVCNEALSVLSVKCLNLMFLNINLKIKSIFNYLLP